jgi:hypothetical protein
MGISQNYIGLQNQIADELGDRQDLLAPLSDSQVASSPIQNAIQGAIAKWEREIFYFNDLNDAAGGGGFSTANGQEFYGAATAPVAYALIANIASFDTVHVLVSGNRYRIIKRTWAYLEEISVNPNVVGQPVEYAYFANQMRFYPIPDNAYPITTTGTQRLSALAKPTDANAWTQDAFDLIRSQAKLIIAEEVIFDDDLAARMKIAIHGGDPMQPTKRGYLYDLKAETSRRQSSGKLRPTYF